MGGTTAQNSGAPATSPHPPQDLPLPTFAPSQDGTVAQRERARRDFAELDAAWRAAALARAERERAARATGDELPPPVEPDFREAFEALADKGSPRALLWLVENFRDARRVERGRALRPEERAAKQRLVAEIVRRHADEREVLSPRLFELLGADPDLTVDDVDAAVRDIVRTSRDQELRAEALLTLAQRIAPPGIDDARAQAQAHAILEELLAGFPGAAASGTARDVKWRLEHLAVGRSAPDFTTHDAVGNEILASDYRGQVLVVQFWGRRHPGGTAHLRQADRLHRHHWDDRFTWLGVNDDPDRAAFRRYCDELDIGWTQAWEGGSSQPAIGAWRVTRPVTYLLDADGVIRGVDLRGPALDRRIAELLAELEADRHVRERIHDAKGGTRDD